MKNRRQPPKSNQLKGLPLYNPVSIEERYSRELRKLVRAMTAETQAAVKELFREPEAKAFFALDANIAVQSRQMLSLLTQRFTGIFNRHSSAMARQMLTEVDNQSKAALMKSFKKMTGEVTLKVADMPESMRTLFEASVSENVDLIKSIPEQYLGRVKGAVNRSITGTGGIGPLIKEIQKSGDMSERRAKNIGMDMTRKAYQTVNIERSKAAGVKKGIWVHTGGTKEPRPKHKAYNGKEFILADGAPIGDKGQNVMPGEEYFCRCTFVPVVDFEDM